MGDGDDRYTKSPKTGIFDDAKNDITPNFDSEASGGSAPQEKKGGFYSQSKLRDAEAAASGDPNSNGRGGDKDASLNAKENNVPSDSDDASTSGAIKNAVKGVQAMKSGNAVAAAQSLSRIKKSGPLGVIIAGVILLGGMAFFGNSLMPFSLVSELQDSFDSINTVSTVRSDRLLRMQLNPNSRKLRYGGYELNNIVKSSIFGKDKFRVSKRQRAKLEANGITFEKIDDVEVMKYQGQRIVADEDLVSEIPGSKSLKQALADGGEFNGSFIRGCMTWRSSVRYWFDTKVGELLLKLRLSRNKMKDAKSGDMDEVSKKMAQGAEDVDLDEGGVSDEFNGIKTDDQSGEVVDSSSNRTSGQTTSLGVQKGDKLSEISNKLKKFSESRASKLAKAGSAIGNAACIVANVTGSIFSLMRALNMTQVRQVAMQALEIIQKAQIGDNVGSSLDTIASTLIKPSTDTYQDGTWTEDADNIEETSIEGSAMQSAGIISVYEKKPRAPDASTKSLNPMSGLSSIGQYIGDLSTSVGAFVTCAGTRIATAALDVVGDAVDWGLKGTEIAVCLAGGAETFGAACAPLLGHLVVDLFKSIAKSAAINIILTKVVSWIVPKVANWLAKDITKNLFGEEYGNVIANGTANLMGSNHQSGGGSLATKDSLIAYNKYQEQVIAEKARYERSTLSPFDPTSKYTFLGSLVSKLGLMANTTSSPLSLVGSLGSTATTSITSLLPHASAIEDGLEAEYLEKYTAEHCENLDSIGALAADAFCNPKMIEDMDTIDTDPAVVMQAASKSKENVDNFESELDSNGMPVIKQNSELMRYIVYYTQRESEFGTADQNIASSVGGDVPTGISWIPVFGSIPDIVTNAKAMDNLGYISGKVGVTGSEAGIGGGVPTWSKTKYYQRFVSDQRLAEGMGLVEKSAVSVALEKYYEEHPLDNSYEGILARKTGMTKDEVIATLDYIDIIAFAEDYEPSDLAPYQKAIEEQSPITIENNAIDNPVVSEQRNAVSFIVRKEYFIA